MGYTKDKASNRWFFLVETRDKYWNSVKMVREEEERQGFLCL
jgi:hypothetical protein